MSITPITVPGRISAGATNVPAVRSLRPPCADGPNDWDLDVGTPESWRAAVRACHGCHLLAHCNQLAQNFIERGDAPRAMIWAGIAYDGSGKVVENLERHRVASIDHKRPMRIIRSGASPLRAEPAPAAPRRHLTLGRPLRPSGAA